MSLNTKSLLKSHITPDYYVYAEINGESIQTGGGSGQGESSSENKLFYRMENKFTVNEVFKEADHIVIEIPKVSIYIDEYTDHEDNYLDVY